MLGKHYPGDVSAEVWSFAAPCLSLLTPDAPLAAGRLSVLAIYRQTVYQQT